MAKWSRIGSDILLFVSCLVAVGDELEWLIACIRDMRGFGVGSGGVPSCIKCGRAASH